MEPVSPVRSRKATIIDRLQSKRKLQAMRGDDTGRERLAAHVAMLASELNRMQNPVALLAEATHAIDSIDDAPANVPETSHGEDDPSLVANTHDMGLLLDSDGSGFAGAQLQHSHDAFNNIALYGSGEPGNIYDGGGVSPFQVDPRVSGSMHGGDGITGTGPSLQCPTPGKVIR